MPAVYFLGQKFQLLRTMCMFIVLLLLLSVWSESVAVRKMVETANLRWRSALRGQINEDHQGG